MTAHETTSKGYDESATKWVRRGTLALVLAGLLFAADSIILLAGLEIPGSEFLFMVANLIALVGVVGFHAVQKHHYGRTGQTGLFLVAAGVLAQTAFSLAFGLGLEIAVIEMLFIAPFFLLAIGFIVYGVATLLARVFPRWVGVLFIAIPVTMLASTMVFIFLEAYAGVGYGLILLALGYALWSKGGEATTEPSANDEGAQVG